MNTFADKKQENKSNVAANRLSQQKVTASLTAEHTEKSATNELQGMLNNSPQAKQLRAYQNMANSVQAKQEAPIQRMSYSKYSGLSGLLSMFSSYTPEEKELNMLETEAVSAYNKIHDYIEKQDYADRVLPLYTELTVLRAKALAPETYEATAGRLREIIKASTGIKNEILRKAKLNKALVGKFDIAEESKGERALAPNTVTPEEYSEIQALLYKIYVSDSSVISIRLESGEHYNLAERSASLKLPVSPNISSLENQIKALNVSKAAREKVVSAEMDKIETTNPKFAAFRTELRMLWEDPKYNLLKEKYLGYVKEYVRDETMKDLVSIAQTGVGRALLKEMAYEKYRANAGVVIAVRDFYGAPTGGPSGLEQRSKVNYTPQAVKDRDTLNRGEGKAITRMEGLKAKNPWQENRRTDITLFHELVHAHHVQDGSLLAKDTLIADEDAVHPADKAFEGSGLASGTKMGVPAEEYQTVGLGKFDRRGFNENTYRGERRAMGEDVTRRTQYTHIDAEGRRVGDESAM